MSLANPLPTTWQAVSGAKDAFEITRRVLERSPSHPQAECQQALISFQQGLRKSTHYETNGALSLVKVKNRPSQELHEVEGLLVLGLWATFERFLRDYLQDKGKVLKQHLQPSLLADNLYEQFAKNVERWEPRDMLNVLKNSFFTTPTLQLLIDDAQNILTYRNWVAHANPNKKSSRCGLEETYNTLNEIINRLLQN